MAITPSPTEQIYSDDYTNLFKHESKLWTAKDITLRSIPGGGLSFRAALYGLLIATMLTGITAIVLLLSHTTLVWAIPVFLSSMIIAYMAFARPAKEGITTSDRLLLEWNWRMRQPRQLLGLAASTEPDELHWQVILWCPMARRPTAMPQIGRRAQ